MTPVSLVLKSEYGDTIGLISNGTEEGALLNLQYEEEKRGGVTTGSFILREGFTVPIRTGVGVVVMKGKTELALLEIDGTPSQVGKDGSIEVSVIGFSARLKKVSVTTTFTSISLKDAIVAQAASAAIVGIAIETGYIGLPSDIVISSASYSETTLFDLIEDVITMANSEIGEDSYQWYVSTAKKLVIVDTRTVEMKSIFEGYQFNSPSIEESTSKLINVVRLWRRKSAFGNEYEYVDEYTADASIDSYGRQEKKIQLSYYASVADCETIANGILAEYSEPEKTISIDGITDDYAYGKMRIMVRPDNRFIRLYSGEEVSVLNPIHSVGVAYSTDDDSAVGVYSTKCVANASASGYVALTLDTQINVPHKVRVFLKGEGNPSVKLVLVDKDGDTEEHEIALSSEWKNYEVEIAEKGWEVGAMSIGGNGIYLPISSTIDRAIFFMKRATIRTLSEIRIAWLTPSATVWVDYIDCLTSQWYVEELNLNKKKVTLSQDTLKYNLVCGGEERTAENELTSLWSEIRRS